MSKVAMQNVVQNKFYNKVLTGQSEEEKNEHLVMKIMSSSRFWRKIRGGFGLTPSYGGEFHLLIQKLELYDSQYLKVF